MFDIGIRSLAIDRDQVVMVLIIFSLLRTLG